MRGTGTGGSETRYLERLAVLPGYRRRGLGKALVAHVQSTAKALGAQRVSIGIIAEHVELRNWYKRLGFVETGDKDFSGLPFRVTFMSYDLHANQSHAETQEKA